MTIMVKSRPKTMSTDPGPRKRFENPLVFTPFQGCFLPKLWFLGTQTLGENAPLYNFMEP